MINTAYTLNNFYSTEELKNRLRLISTQNTMWTRNYIVSYVSDLEDIVVLENRLYVNAIDFRQVFNVYYDDEVSAKVESLLRNYISNLIETLRLTKANYLSPETSSQGDLIKAEENWKIAGIELAQYLSNINTYWKLEQIQTLIIDHIEMTIDQMQQRLRKEYAYEVHQYDFIEYHSIMIADILSKGIIDMFY